ncbi:MAG: HTH-type transcriptional regulator TtgV [Stenotrophomonas maltophilia]|nr:MAG: HTH-type transcriptional regulator TtgV [Stenotrophomonas maltophilia]
MSEEREAGNGKQVIARAAAVLRALENQTQGLSLGQIAKAAELPRTTVHRLIGALEAQQLVISAADGIRLGPALARLAASAHTDVVGIARPFVEALGRRTRETVDLCVFRGLHSISVEQYACDQELRVVSPVGTAFASHCTAHGKALLAQLPTDELGTLLRGVKLEKRTPATLSSLARLKDELAQVREQGIAIDREEHARGVCGIGVALRSGLSERYAIALAVPALRFDEQFERLRASLLQCQAEIEALLGAA